MSDTRQILIVLPAELTGASVYIDDDGGGHTVTAQVGEFPEATARVDLRIGADCSDCYTFVVVDKEGYRHYRRDGVEIVAGRDRQIRIGSPIDPSRPHDTWLPSVQPNIISLDDPLLTPLKIVGNGIIADANGRIRQIHGCSDFPQPRIWLDDQPEIERTLDSMVRARRVMCRSFYGLAESETDYGGYWAGRMVNPYDHMQRALVPLAHAYDVRGLKMHLTGGYRFAGGWPEEKAFIQWLARTLRDDCPPNILALFSWRNEFPLTSPYGGDSVETYAHGAEACQIMREALGCLTTMGAPGEDDDAIARSIEHTQIAAIDGMRGMEGQLMMKHADRFAYAGRYQGKYRGRGLHVVEPTGPNTHPDARALQKGEVAGAGTGAGLLAAMRGGSFATRNMLAHPPGAAGAKSLDAAAGSGDDVYLPLNDRAYVFGYYGTHAVTGQACSYFSGPSVRHHVPLNAAWGFDELVPLLSFIPDDVASWGGWTYFQRGNEFVTVGAEAWGTIERPPRPVKSWTALFYDGTVQEGGGTPALAAGYKAAIVKGTFA